MIYSTKSQKSSLSSFLINPHFSNASSPSQKKVIFDEWHAKKWVQYICISILPFWLVHQFLGAQLALKAPSSPEGCNNADIRRMNGSKVSHCTTSSLEKCIPFHHEVKHNNSSRSWEIIKVSLKMVAEHACNSFILISLQYEKMCQVSRKVRE